MWKTVTTAVTIVVTGIVLTFPTAVSASATFKTSSGGTAYTGPFQARSTSNIVFRFIPGSIICAHAYGMIANGSMTSPTIQSSFALNGSVSARNTFFGSNLATTATVSKPCPTDFGFISCTARQSPKYDSPGVTGYTLSASQAASGGTVTVQLSKFVFVLDCLRDDGSITEGCTYITGTSTAGGPITGAAPYVSGKASTISFTDQPFVRMAGPGSCPGATAGSPGKFIGSIGLYTGSSAAAGRIVAY